MAHQHDKHSAHRHHRPKAGGGPRIASQLQGSTTEIAHHLSALAEALRRGGVSIRAGDRAVGLRPGDQLTFDLLAEAGEDHSGRIVMLLAWQAPHAGLSTPPLHISSLPPEGQPERNQPDYTSEDEEHQPPAPESDHPG